MYLPHQLLLQTPTARTATSIEADEAVQTAGIFLAWEPNQSNSVLPQRVVSLPPVKLCHANGSAQAYLDR
jgi:hypothetical protein